MSVNNLINKLSYESGLGHFIHISYEEALILT